MQLSTSTSFPESAPLGALIAGTAPLSAAGAPDPATRPVASFADLMAPVAPPADPSAPVPPAPPVPVPMPASDFLLPGELSPPVPPTALRDLPLAGPSIDALAEAVTGPAAPPDEPAEAGPDGKPIPRMRAVNPSSGAPDRLVLEAAAALYQPILPAERPPLAPDAAVEATAATTLQRSPDVAVGPLPPAPGTARADFPWLASAPAAESSPRSIPFAAEPAAPAGSKSEVLPVRAGADLSEPPRDPVNAEKPAVSPAPVGFLKTGNARDTVSTPAAAPSDPASARVGANFAELPRIPVNPEKPAVSPGPINFLNTESDKDTETATNLGTDVAKSSAVMSRASPHRFSPAFESGSPVAPAVAAAAPAAPAFGAPPIAQPQALPVATPTETLAAAHRAVDAVMAAADRFTPASPSVVNLRLEVGDQNLGVRVELRDGAVHATFRTDSPELRAALDHEWRVAVAQPQDPSLRLAAPVFAAGDRPGDDARSAFSGEHPAHARDQAARQTAGFILPGGVRGRAGSPAGPSDTAADPVSARNVPTGSVHLHAFA